MLKLVIVLAVREYHYAQIYFKRNRCAWKFDSIFDNYALGKMVGCLPYYYRIHYKHKCHFIAAFINFFIPIIFCVFFSLCYLWNYLYSRCHKILYRNLTKYEGNLEISSESEEKRGSLQYNFICMFLWVTKKTTPKIIVLVGCFAILLRVTRKPSRFDDTRGENWTVSSSKTLRSNGHEKKEEKKNSS